MARPDDTRKEVVKEEVIVVKVKKVPAAPDAPFTVNEDRHRELAITPRELEILGLLARGLRAREIAAALFVSENTVKTRTARLFDKLGVNRRIKAVEAARSQIRSFKEAYDNPLTNARTRSSSRSRSACSSP